MFYLTLSGFSPREGRQASPVSPPVPEKNRMSNLAEGVFQSERPGYWAVQIRLEPASDVSRRYLCHAADQRAAVEIAGRLMGSRADVRGFKLSWIDATLLEGAGRALPVLGGQRTVPDSLEWAQLVAMSARSEVRSQAERTRQAIL